MTSFSCGFQWFYWDWYKDQTEIPINRNMAAEALPNGYEPRELYVKRKYNSYKEEMLHHISHRQYRICSNKANQQMTSIKVKKLSSKGIDEVLHYGIPAYSTITRNHILSVILYCDLDRYSTKFSETFRRMKQYETLESVKWRNSQYWWQARLLSETVSLWGPKGRGLFCM